MNRAITLIKYENYFRLLNNLIPEILALGLFDSQGQCVWSSCDEHSIHDAKLNKHVKNHPVASLERTPVPFVWQQLDSDETISSLYLEDENNDASLNLLVLMQSAGSWENSEITAVQDKMITLGECIRNEQGLNQELEDMADELGMRYDELNLVYQSESHSVSLYHTQDSLRRLVADCLGFLGTGMVALLLPGKNITIFEFDKDRTVTGSAQLLSNLKGVFFETLRQQQASIVINNTHDAHLLNLANSELPYKFLLSPIDKGEGDVIGMLAIINADYDSDFSNSDRNLLNVMANKVTKVILANFDSLTGLENEHSFEANVNQVLAESRGNGSEHTVLKIDIDRITVINDIAGREAGDAAISLVGECLFKLVRSRDSVARLSGDKFGVILESCPLSTARDLATRMSENIESLDFKWAGQKFELSACIGVAPVTVQNESVSALLSSVEIACNAAKERGRNRIQVYEQNSTELLQRKGEMQWIGRIQSALREGRFVLFSQLIQGLGPNKELQHFEILLRLTGENGTLISPMDFLPAAERYKLMPDIDRWVIQQTFDQALQAMDAFDRFPCQLSINLSGQSLSNETFTDFILEQLDRLGPHVENICFEITESSAIANLSEARSLISRVKSRGCQFSLDDFGTGLSSFAYLQNLDVDFLKIDGCFVRKIIEDPVSESMVSAINQVGHAMKLLTVAEYVENEAILLKLQDIGVDFGQGYGLGKPQPLKTCLEDLLARENISRDETQDV
ncbi:MAG: EAL domain-containing protein [Gammaproteobacteria bacterium]|nr:EAL domain-containing protein [Gammaproteobacteria bacterium]